MSNSPLLVGDGRSVVPAGVVPAGIPHLLSGISGWPPLAGRLTSCVRPLVRSSSAKSCPGPRGQDRPSPLPGQTVGSRLASDRSCVYAAVSVDCGESIHSTVGGNRTGWQSTRSVPPSSWHNTSAGGDSELTQRKPLWPLPVPSGVGRGAHLGEVNQDLPRPADDEPRPAHRGVQLGERTTRLGIGARP